MLKVGKQLRAQYVVSIQNQLSMQSGTVRFLDNAMEVKPEKWSGFFRNSLPRLGGLQHEVGWIKFNVDASTSSNPEVATAAGLARDDNGQWLLGFRTDVGWETTHYGAYGWQLK
ncbi:hypothetical protein Acr_00g0063750 [Actinidia rufa]|uniref:Uncharacterized protein n=1 Tax=Actinidia rufa TaxID=165716 RepID=A0A7J0DR68_9ERIC|nr:hypothetical protein Acr_00g0063750 [Actinidia rufa]